MQPFKKAPSFWSPNFYEASTHTEYGRFLNNNKTPANKAAGAWVVGGGGVRYFRGCRENFRAGAEPEGRPGGRAAVAGRDGTGESAGGGTDSTAGDVRTELSFTTHSFPLKLSHGFNRRRKQHNFKKLLNDTIKVLCPGCVVNQSFNHCTPSTVVSIFQATKLLVLILKNRAMGRCTISLHMGNWGDMHQINLSFKNTAPRNHTSEKYYTKKLVLI